MSKELKRDSFNSAPSLLTTIFGDSILPYGGVVWLGSLIKLAQPFGINQRLVRTSVYRLAQDEWVHGCRVGRKSFYQLTRTAELSSRQAQARIYHAASGAWDGEWRLIFVNTTEVSAGQRAELRRRMPWLGFGVIAPNVYGHPTPDMNPVWELFDGLGLAGKFVAMRARNFDSVHGLDSREMAHRCWKLDKVAAGYEAFMSRFQSFVPDTGSIVEPDPERAFALRTLLVHEFRRVLLRDPQLPPELLPERWVGHGAYELCRALYWQLHEPAARHLADTCESTSGRFTLPSEDYFNRFGGTQ